MRQNNWAMSKDTVVSRAVFPFGLIQHSIQWPPYCTDYWTGESFPFQWILRWRHTSHTLAICRSYCIWHCFIAIFRWFFFNIVKLYKQVLL